MTDRELLIALQQSKGAASQDLLTQLIARHVNLVYSLARRQVKEPHLAQDIAQEVFITLMRKAPTLNPEIPLVGWLFTTTRRWALQALCAASRRELHEREVAMTEGASTDPTWSLIAGDIDQAVADLAPKERDALLLRYFSGKSHLEIATDLAISEEAAKKRVQRALDSLRALLTHRGFATPTAGLAAALTIHASAEAVPPTVAAAITQATLHVVSTTATSSGLTTLKGMLMALHLKTAAAVGAVSLAIGIPATLATVHYLAESPVPPSLSASLPVTTDLSAADFQPNDDLETFNRIYSLKTNEFVKLIAPPFNEARSAGYDQLAQMDRERRAQALQAQRDAATAAGQPLATTGGITIPGGGMGSFSIGGGGGGGGGGGPMGGLAPGVPFGGMGGMIPGAAQWGTSDPTGAPAAMIIKWRENAPAELIWKLGGAGSQFPISQLLMRSFALEGVDLEGDVGLLRREIAGDFIVRGNATDEQLCSGYEQIFSEALGQKVTLNFREVDQKVIVFRGKWNYKPLDPAEAGGMPNIHLYSKDVTAPRGSGGGGDPKHPSFFNALSREVRMPLVMEGEGVPAILSYTEHDAPDKEPDVKRLLDHVTEQTGLTWTEETRKVRHLLVEASKLK